MDEVHGRERTDEREKTPITMPMSSLDPPRCETKSGKRKKQPKLEVVKKLATDMVRKVRVYRVGVACMKGKHTRGIDFAQQAFYPQPFSSLTEQSAFPIYR